MLIPALTRAIHAAADRDELLRRLRRSAASTFRRSMTCATPTDGTIAAFEPKARHRRAADGEEGGGQERRSARSAGDLDLHARHGVRLAIPDRSRARLRESVPLLLGGIQLSARPRVSRRSDPASSRAQAKRSFGQGRPGVDRAVRSPGDRTDPHRAARHGLLDQSGLAATRRSDRADRRSCCARAASGRSRSRRRPARIGCGA